MTQIKYKHLLNVGVAAYVLQGAVMAALLLNTDKLARQARYLASFVEKNVESLDEFDIIALRELGIIKSKE